MVDLSNLNAAFQTEFGTNASRFFWAPGRVNLIGEHTDYNDGFVMPMALDRGTMVAAARRSDSRVRAYSLNLGQLAEFSLVHPEPYGESHWANYVAGVGWILSDRYGSHTGANLAIESDLPIGAGLSSSAAIELSIGLALASVSNVNIDPLSLALAGQQAEHTYVGIKCGIMDQYVSAFGRKNNAVLLDCRTLESQQIPLSLGDAEIVVCDSHVQHELASSEYNKRRSECEQGVEILRTVLPGIRALRDVSAGDLERNRELLPVDVMRRCRHVITENDRTLGASEALKAGNLAEMGRLMAASHASLRDDYQVSCPELDLLVDSALSVDGVLGARLTGGGFGGCTVNLVEMRSVDSFKRTVIREYQRAFGKKPSIYKFEASDGAREIIRE